MIDERDYDSWDQPRITWHIKYQRPLAASETDQPSADQAVSTATAVEEGFETNEVHATANPGNTGGHNTKDSYRLRAKVSVKKDEVQAVLPIAKHKEMMNLAVLTGRQVSRPLKIFIVSQAGDVADVTLHSSCSSADQSVLKVMHSSNWLSQIRPYRVTLAFTTPLLCFLWRPLNLFRFEKPLTFLAYLFSYASPGTYKVTLDFRS